jgi:hypothetical protein
MKPLQVFLQEVRRIMECSWRGLRGCTNGMMIVGIVSALALGLIGLAPAASADPIGPLDACGQSFHPIVRGGEAYWVLTCSGGYITMQGWVKDTAADGKCAQVKGVFNNNIVRLSNKACPKGEKESFTWRHPGTIANGYLMVT